MMPGLSLRDMLHGVLSRIHLTVQVVIAPSPAHTTAAILQREAPSINPKNITALSRLAHNRTLAHVRCVLPLSLAGSNSMCPIHVLLTGACMSQVAEHLAISVGEVKNVVVWGNATSLQVPDAQHGTVMRVPMGNVLDAEFMEELAVSVQKRSAAILEVLEKSHSPSCH
jgi:malate/lactate dehydrogenase